MSEYQADIIGAVSYGASHKLEGGNGLQRAFSILLFSVFVVVDLLALMAGTSAYGSITRMQAANDERIMSMGPITSSIRANDTAGGVATGTGPEGRSLVLVQRDAQGTYETRIYLYEGNLVQEFALEGSAYTPGKAVVLAPSSTFDFSYSHGLLTVSTDYGTSEVALRNLQGGA